MAILWFCVKLFAMMGLLWQFAADGWAQRYPEKVVRLIVPFSPGSGNDTIGRVFAAGLGEVFGQQVIVDNRAGAGGNLGAGIAAKAAPDGYTVLLINSGHAANVTLYNNLQYDLLRDFAAVTQLTAATAVVVVHPSLPVKSIAELVKLAKAKPGAITYASGGIGTPTFIAGELFKRHTGVDMLHVPYRSGGEAITASIAGETSVYLSPISSALPYIKQGRLRALAVTSAKRLTVFPDYPTVAESGYPNYVAQSWQGLVAPAKTPPETITALYNAAHSVLNDPKINKRLNDMGYEIVADRPKEFAAYIKSQIETVGNILRANRVGGN